MLHANLRISEILFDQVFQDIGNLDWANEDKLKLQNEFIRFLRHS